MRKQFLVRTVLAFLALQILGSASYLRAQANGDVFGDVFNVRNFGATGKKADIATQRARYVQPPSARVGRGTHQSGGVGMVLQIGRAHV